MWSCLHILLMEVCGLEVEGLPASPTVRTNSGVGDYCKVEVQKKQSASPEAARGVAAASDGLTSRVCRMLVQCAFHFH